MDKEMEARCALMSAEVMQALKESNPSAYKEELKRLCEGRPSSKAFRDKFREIFPKWVNLGEFD